jgi:hypothetical protein
MIFDFGTNEEAAQQARQKIDRWKQGFRLGEKMTVKFEREEAAEAAAAENGDAIEEEEKSTKKSAAKKSSAKKSKEEAAGRVRVFVRLGFSEHEKLSQQRWLDRIPAEEPFKSAKGETIRHNDPEFPKSIEIFEALD